MRFNRTKNAIVVGCSRLGSALATFLFTHGYNTVIIDKDEESFRKLPENFSGFQAVGDATDSALLEKYGIKQADTLVVATNYDNVNSLIAQVGARIYDVPNVYARIIEPEREVLLDGFNIKIIFPFKLSVEEFIKLSNIEVEVDE